MPPKASVSCINSAISVKLEESLRLPGTNKHKLCNRRTLNHHKWMVPLPPTLTAPRVVQATCVCVKTHAGLSSVTLIDPPGSPLDVLAQGTPPTPDSCGATMSTLGNTLVLSLFQNKVVRRVPQREGVAITEQHKSESADQIRNPTRLDNTIIATGGVGTHIGDGTVTGGENTGIDDDTNVNMSIGVSISVVTTIVASGPSLDGTPQMPPLVANDHLDQGDQGSDPNGDLVAAEPTTTVSHAEELVVLATARMGLYTTFQQLTFVPKSPLASITDEYHPADATFSEPEKLLLLPILLLTQLRHFGPPTLFFSTRSGHSMAIVNVCGPSVLKGQFMWSDDGEAEDAKVSPLVRMGDVKRLSQTNPSGCHQ
ncbi:hypothetical protein DFH07DRAFT_765231 [Mycena maculata]|uniref:Uncharacterized protein n=1 Tax=Mycena maculata TaxID=230809 RepID=A0AAD7NYM5_9AGAR|nr:hypothetical protein DFH07DRAFT_765231 [Mycena maculata]